MIADIEPVLNRDEDPVTERFIVDVGDHDPRDWEPAERPDPSEYLINDDGDENQPIDNTLSGATWTADDGELRRDDIRDQAIADAWPGYGEEPF